MKIKLLVAILLSIIVLQAEDSISKQIWANYILGYPQSEKLYFELDFEPKAQTDGALKWRNLDVTALLEYYPNSWIDLTAEIVSGYTKDSEHVKTFEVSPRLGVRIHIFGNLREYIPTYDLFSLNRFSLATLFRYEYRTLSYSDKSTDHQSRFRVRIETKTAFNNKRFTDDDTYYMFADLEQYFDFGDEVKEVFSNKTRFRIGPGYTYNKKHRFEILAIYDYARDTFEGDARQDALIINFRYKVSY